MQFFVRRSRSFRLFFLASLVLLCGLFIVGCARAPTRGWSGLTISEGILYAGTLDGEVVGLSASNGTHRWQYDLDVSGTGGSSLACAGRMSTAMSIYSTPVVYDGWLYVGGYDGIVYAINIDNKARREFETDGAIIGSPTVADGTLFIGSSDDKLYAISLDTWQEKWVFKTGDKIWSTPVVDDGVVYIGSSDHKLYAIDADTGAEKWHFEAEGAILSTPLVVNDTVYIGSSDRKFYAIDVEQTTQEVEAKGVFEGAGNWFWTQALAYDNVIYVGNLDHKLYALDAMDIENKLWEYKTDGMIRTPPILVKGWIVIGSQDGKVYAFDPGGPRKEWDLEEPVLAPLCADAEKGIVYTHAQNGDHIIYAIDVETDVLLWEYQTD